ncbi:MAG TPA: hypothetical protein VFY41_05570 [Nitrososphaeraceae archaeon]|nr:hypothetical protein [Nitrososphaeraceae archaeon]
MRYLNKKGVRTIGNKACGVVVTTTGDKIWVVDGAVNLKKYRILKSKVNFYNGSELILKIPTFLMQEYEY